AVGLITLPPVRIRPSPPVSIAALEPPNPRALVLRSVSVGRRRGLALSQLAPPDPPARVHPMDGAARPVARRRRSGPEGLEEPRREVRRPQWNTGTARVGLVDARSSCVRNVRRPQADSRRRPWSRSHFRARDLHGRGFPGGRIARRADRRGHGDNDPEARRRPPLEGADRTIAVLSALPERDEGSGSRRGPPGS